MDVVNKIVMLPIDSIKPYEKNPRKNSKTVEMLAKIIPRVGFNVPLVLDKENVIVKGHARFLAAQKLGMKEVPCVISDADPESIKADRIADNKVFEFSTWINEELKHEIDMLELDFDPAEFGLPKMDYGSDLPAFEFKDDDLTESPADEAERKRKYEEWLQRMEEEAKPVEVVTQQQVSYAKERQREEAVAPPNYIQITCEKCGSVMFVREGDDMVWE